MIKVIYLHLLMGLMIYSTASQAKDSYNEELKRKVNKQLCSPLDASFWLRENNYIRQAFYDTKQDIWYSLQVAFPWQISSQTPESELWFFFGEDNNTSCSITHLDETSLKLKLYIDFAATQYWPPGAPARDYWSDILFYGEVECKVAYDYNYFCGYQWIVSRYDNASLSMSNSNIDNSVIRPSGQISGKFSARILELIEELLNGDDSHI